MLAAQRQRFILDLLEKQGSVRTMDLAQRLEVTDETVRRDLDFMEGKALLRRTHGGAVRGGWVSRDRSFAERQVENIQSKQAIARAALPLIAEGDTVFIDASSTALQIVPLLGSFPIRVLTHSLLVAQLLAEREKVDLVLCGGAFDRVSGSFLGTEVAHALERRRVDKVFCSGNGIEPRLGASEVNQQQAFIKELMIARCTRLIYLADSSKLGCPSTFYFAQTVQIDTFISEAPLEHPVMLELRDSGVECLSAGDLI